MLIRLYWEEQACTAEWNYGEHYKSSEFIVRINNIDSWCARLLQGYCRISTSYFEQRHNGFVEFNMSGGWLFQQVMGQIRRVLRSRNFTASLLLTTSYPCEINWQWILHYLIVVQLTLLGELWRKRRRKRNWIILSITNTVLTVQENMNHSVISFDANCCKSMLFVVVGN